MILVNQLTTQCDEAEVDIKVYEEMLRKNPGPQPESISRPSSHRLEALPSEGGWLIKWTGRCLAPVRRFPSSLCQFNSVTLLGPRDPKCIGREK